MENIDLVYVNQWSFKIIQSGSVQKHIKMAAITRLQNKMNTKQTIKSVLVRKSEWN